MKTPEHGTNRESHEGEVWLEKIKNDNPDMDFIDGVAEITAIAERQLDREYGPMSSTPLAYHNAQHSSDVAERGLRLLRLHQENSPGSFDMKRAPSLVVSAAKLHDIVQLKGAVTNERMSAEYARRILPHYGFTHTEADLEADMIMATVTQQVDGKLRQTMLEKIESRDPLCLVLATADINGIAMEGLPRMVKDSINLSAERYQVDAGKILVERPHEVAKLLGAQVLFFGSRLDQVEDDLKIFYDEATASRIQEAYQREFGSLGSEAIRAASILNRRPECISDILSKNVTAVTDVAMSAIVTRLRKLLLH